MRSRATLAGLAATLLLAPGALAAGAASPGELGLAKSLKAELQRVIGAKVRGTKLTTVTCRISADMAGAKCAAHFTRANVKGTYQVAVSEDASGNAQWKVTSAVCTNARTGANVKPCK